MKYTSCCTDADDRKEVGLFQKVHDKKAGHASGERVEGSKHSAEEKPGKKNTDQVCGKGISGIHAIEDNQRHQVCQTEFDSRYSCIERNQDFHIGEDEGQSGQEACQSHSAGTDLCDGR